MLAECYSSHYPAFSLTVHILTYTKEGENSLVFAYAGLSAYNKYMYTEIKKKIRPLHGCTLCTVFKIQHSFMKIISINRNTWLGFTHSAQCVILLSLRAVCVWLVDNSEPSMNNAIIPEKDRSTVGGYGSRGRACTDHRVGGSVPDLLLSIYPIVLGQDIEPQIATVGQASPLRGISLPSVCDCGWMSRRIIIKCFA